MADVRVQTLADALGVPAGVGATLRVQVYEGLFPAVRVAGELVTFPVEAQMVLTGSPGEVFALYTLPPNLYWRVTVHGASFAVVRNVILPAGSGPFDFADLVDVNPVTALPDPGTALADAFIAELEAIRDATIAIAVDDVSVSAQVTSGPLTQAALAAQPVSTATQAALDSYEIWAIAGQSNAVGAALDGSSVIDTEDPRVFQYAGSGANAGQIIAATRNLFHPTGVGDFGFGLSFGKIRAALTGKKILLVPLAKSGTVFVATGAYVDTWSPGGTPLPGGIRLYDDMFKTGLTAALAAAGVGARLAGVLWLQGESDGANNVSQATWASNFDYLASTIRTDFGANVPIVLGPMVPEGLVSVTGRVAIQAAHKDTPARVERTAWFDGPINAYRENPPGTPDTTHYDAEGQRILARGFADGVQRATQNVKGVIPPLVLNLRATDTGFYWDVPPGRVTGYEVGVSVNGSAESFVTVTSPMFAISFEPADYATARVRAIAEAGSGAWAYVSRADISGVGAPDPMEGLTFDTAVSFRRLPGYAGALFTVRRSSDSTTLDCKSVAEAVAFVGSGSGYVSKMFDQSGSGRHYVQATDSRQPCLISAGALYTQGGRPVAYFDSTDDALTYDGAGAWGAGACSVAVVQVSTGGESIGQPIWGEFSSSSASPMYYLGEGSQLTFSPFGRDNVNSVFLPTSTTNEDPDAFNPMSPREVNAIATGTVLKRRVGKTSLPDTAYASSTTTLNRSAINAMYRTGSLSTYRGMLFGELLIKFSAWSDVDRNKVEDSQSDYWSLA